MMGVMNSFFNGWSWETYVHVCAYTRHIINKIKHILLFCGQKRKKNNKTYITHHVIYLAITLCLDNNFTLVFITFTAICQSSAIARYKL